MKGFYKISTILLIVIVVVGGGYYALITYYFGGMGEGNNVGPDNATIKNDYGFEYKSDFRLEEFITVFNSLPKTIQEACDNEGIEKRNWEVEGDCGWPRDYSQDDLINWKQWIEKGILNHSDRYTKYRVMDYRIGVGLEESDDAEFIDRSTKLKESIIEEKIINIGGKKALKRIYHSPQSPSAEMELAIFNNDDLIILLDDFATWKGQASNGQDLGELSKEEIKNHPRVILFDKIISTFRFTK